MDDWDRALQGLNRDRSWADFDAIGMNASMDVTAATTTDSVTRLAFTLSSRFNGTAEAYMRASDGTVSTFRIPAH